MKAVIAKYLSIFKIELEDLETDIVSLIELTEERKLNKEITEYVGLENVSLLQAEFAGIKCIGNSIDEYDISKYAGLDDFVSDFKKELKKKIRNSGYPDAVYLFVERKADKVAKYVSEQI